VVEGFAGPLAGVLTGMEWTRAHRPDCPWIVTIATDTPFFPRDLVARLLRAVGQAGADLACAASGGRAHPVFGLWPVRLAEELRAAMVEEGIRKVDVWTARHPLVEVAFAGGPTDPFFNTNRPEDLAEAERLLGGMAAAGSSDPS
jgi:molybdopterin-guanine dinucleotide biosynthesis protein A